MRTDDATRERHFEALYAANDDPWDVRGSWYERRKRSLLLACLDKPRYRSVFEPGCGNGEMSAALAARADRLLACDGSASALAAARRRVHAVQGIDCALQLEQRRLPSGWPRDASFDLVVISELAYYFDDAALRDMFAMAAACLEPGGELVLCHYRHDFEDRVTATADAHALADAVPGLVRKLHHLESDFLLEAWRRTETHA